MDAEPQRRRRILVVGGYGLIGAYVLARLQARNLDIVGFGREIEVAARRFPYAKWIAGDMATMTTPDAWQEALSGVDAVVNCAGALQNGPRDHLAVAHVEGTLALYRACVTAGVRRVVHVSAAGVVPGRPTAFNRTKQEAEDGLKALDLDWLILRPGFVIAPSAYGGSALLRGLAAFPLVIPVVHSRSIVQPVSVEDVAEAVIRATEPWRHARLSIDIVSTDTPTFADILTRMRGWLGLAPAPVLRIPAFLAWPFVLIADLVGGLGWRSPMRSTAMRQLKAGITGDGEAAQRVLGIKPRDFTSMLAAWPSGVQERWFARLYFLKPLAILTLALFWLASGAIGLARLDLATSTLDVIGWPPLVATGAIAVGSLAAIALGLAACVRSQSRRALKLMAVLPVLFGAAATAMQPGLWLNPLGPLVKLVPAVVLALVASALMDER
ncbi:NADH-ubiquinone oxidoreductase [Kaistia algarum]|uniref:NAD(P)H-binding protein n=1 Tax=Kaistia algarum TaxID=2083279 RepID=UPI000CE93610|nr:NAD(P)H-binding protein [Kaistia algarum]MCX5516678.1 NAD(P)H-binding protein [Kaistia algarum]PPE78577.1 NADH-ubiquinone oxidoreductase [Kaistia algarum]